MSRSPHGERGLKSTLRSIMLRQARRSPHGERGLKLRREWWSVDPHSGRSPHGERGLKF